MELKSALLGSEQIEILGHVVLAMIFGALIGLEREIADKPAGLRTHMLVAGTASLFVMLGPLLVHHFEARLPSAMIRTDPTRLIQAIVIGISFLGAGTIIRQGGTQRVEGLTTAASILFAAAIGVCIGLSQIILATGVTILVLVTLRQIGKRHFWHR